MATDELKVTYEKAPKLSLIGLVIRHWKMYKKRRWDRRWDATFASPESIADMEKMRAKIDRDIASGNTQNYISDDHLEELF
jgi:hypothetical protein